MLFHESMDLTNTIMCNKRLSTVLCHYCHKQYDQKKYQSSATKLREKETSKKSGHDDIGGPENGAPILLKCQMVEKM